MKITDVEAIILRQPVLDDGIADGSQDDLVIKIHTDEGITGIGEVDSAPEAVHALVSAHELARDRELVPQPARRRGSDRRGAALAEDVPRHELHRPARDRAARAERHRHRALGHQGQGARASRSARCSAARCATRCARTPRCSCPTRPRRRRSASPRSATTASRRSSSGGGRSARIRSTTCASPPPRRRPRGDGDILIDAGLGYGADAKTAIGVARELEQLGVYWLEEPFEPDEYEAYAELADAVDIRVAAGEQDTTRVGLPRADRARPRRPRPAGRDALRRDHRADPDRGARARARRRDRAARVEERHHQGGVAPRERRPAGRDCSRSTASPTRRSIRLS